MTLSNFVIERVFQLIRNETLPNCTPIRIRVFSGNTDVSSTLFGSSFYSFSFASWGTPSNRTISNSSALVFGNTSTNFNGVLTFNLYTNTDDYLCNVSANVILSANTEFSINIGAITIQLPNLSINLANLLLNYIFRNSLATRPAQWFLQNVNTSNTPIGSRIALDPLKFSLTYDNEIGQKQINYGDYLFTNLTADTRLLRSEIYANSSGGNSWLEFNSPSYYQGFNGRTLEFYTNSLVLNISPINLDINFKLENKATSIFHVDCDGSMEDLAGTADLSSAVISYNSLNKLFKGQCASFLTAERASYSNFNFPQFFTIDFFVRFTSSANNRTVIFFNKEGAVRLDKTSSNAIRILLNGAIALETAWNPIVNVWYHIYIQKNSANRLVLRINNEVNTFNVLQPGLTINNNNNLLTINDPNFPILGICNGLYIDSSESTYQQGIQPICNNRYIWKFINSNVWTQLNFTQYKEYFRI